MFAICKLLHCGIVLGKKENIYKYPCSTEDVHISKSDLHV